MELLYENFYKAAVAGVVLIVIGVISYFKWAFQYWERLGVPYLKPSIPFGTMGNPVSTKESLGMRASRQYKEAKEKGYKHLGLFEWMNPCYLAMDINIIKGIMSQDFNHFTDRGFLYDEKNDPLSAHLFTLAGPKWKYLRAKLTPTFTSGKMKMMFNIILKCSQELKGALDVELRSGPIDTKNILERFGIDVIGSCAFGIDCNSFKDLHNDFGKYARKVFAITTLRKLKFVLSMVPIFKKIVNINLPSDITSFFLKIVKENYQYRKANNVVRNDFFQLLIGLLKENSSDNDGLTIEEMAAEAFVFFIAGFETSSTTVSFCMFELSLNQDIQQKLRDEIDKVLKRHNGEMSYDSLKELVYMDQVINETMRKYPALPMLNRQCTMDYQVPNSNIILEKGIKVTIPLRAIQNDPEYFPEPEKFDPERFSKDNKDKILPFTYMPFGEGPRVCIGLRFGIMQAKVALTVLVKNYKFTLNEKTTLPLKINPMSFVISAKDGIWLNEYDCTHKVNVLCHESNLVLRLLTYMNCEQLNFCSVRVLHPAHIRSKLPPGAVLIVMYIIVYYKWAFHYWKRLGVPYIKPTIPFGTMENPVCMKESFAMRASWQYKEATEKGYKHLGLFNWTKPSYLAVDINVIKNIMSVDFNHFTDRGIPYNEKDDPLSAHLFTLIGPKWKQLRAKLTPTFTSGKMKMMFNIILKCSHELKEALDIESDRGPIDIKHILESFGIDVIGSCAFGIDCNSFKNPHNDFGKYARKIFLLTKLRKIKVAIAMSTIFQKILGLKFLPSDATDFFLNVVKENYQYRKANNVVRNDFFQLLIGLLKENSPENDGLTIEELAAEAFVFFIAGFETSSTTVTFCMLELSLNQDIQQKLRDEIEEVLKRHNGEMSYDSLKELVYMDQVIHETLRKYPALPILNRQCTMDYQIPNSNIVLKKGIDVAIPLHGIQNNPEYFPEPEKFDPERFSQKNKDKIIPFTYMPFGEGPRICIGLRFGMMQAKVALTLLVKNYRFVLNEKTQLPLKIQPLSFVICAKDGIWLDAEKI
ncbi:hypothetical protein FQA39_LY04148 [Lamprigera yunnana]|nr:hypothetical protein FQA39_LY04148 [Lamprigera yunnana]